MKEPPKEGDWAALGVQVVRVLGDGLFLVRWPSLAGASELVKLDDLSPRPHLTPSPVRQSGDDPN